MVSQIVLLVGKVNVYAVLSRTKSTILTESLKWTYVWNSAPQNSINHM